MHAITSYHLPHLTFPQRQNMLLKVWGVNLTLMETSLSKEVKSFLGPVCFSERILVFCRLFGKTECFIPFVRSKVGLYCKRFRLFLDSLSLMGQKRKTCLDLCLKPSIMDPERLVAGATGVTTWMAGGKWKKIGGQSERAAAQHASSCRSLTTPPLCVTRGNNSFAGTA